MMLGSHLSWIALGAVVGAWSRYGLAVFLNPVIPHLGLGTLAANLIGGFFIGLIIPFTSHANMMSDATRLALITGFLGALTTFSTFSAETVMLFARKEYFWGVSMMSMHLFGSLLMTVVGIVCMKWWVG